MIIAYGILRSLVCPLNTPASRSRFFQVAFYTGYILLALDAMDTIDILPDMGVETLLMLAFIPPLAGLLTNLQRLGLERK